MVKGTTNKSETQQFDFFYKLSLVKSITQINLFNINFGNGSSMHPFTIYIESKTWFLCMNPILNVDAIIFKCVRKQVV